MLRKLTEYLLPSKVLFHRDFRHYTGGHQKVFDYFSHLKSHRAYRPYIHFSEVSRWDETNPWYGLSRKWIVPFEPARYDLLFLAGMDWQAYLATGLLPNKPVVNLIQHVRHAIPGQDVYPFLKHKAIRICVSQEVADAIRETGRVNGPVFTIPNGHEIGCAPQTRVRDVYILGLKQPALAQALAERVEQAGHKVLLTTDQCPRDQVLQNMAASRVTVALPNTTEGFYLPALEAMALSDIAVVPDCVGNRSFCLHQQNCLMPAMEPTALVQAVGVALSIIDDRDHLSRIRARADETLRSHSLQAERKAFYELLDNLSQVW